MRSHSAACGATYFSADILFDNVLTGDYEQIVPGSSGGLTAASGGSPLVHIRALPEGGPAGSVVATKKDPSMEGRKLLLLRPQLVDEKDPAKFRPGLNTIVAVDSVGAGVGE